MNAQDLRTLLERNNRDSENNIQPYEIADLLNSDEQIKFVSMLENMDLTLSQKKEILVSLNDDVKQIIDSGNFLQEYKNIIRIPTAYINNRKEVFISSKIELETYRGLDDLIIPIFAEKFTEIERTVLMELCDICPNLRVESFINSEDKLVSTGAEYNEAEEWITSVLNNLDDNYSEAQKIALIDNAICKKVSFSPDCHTEVFDVDGSRALWKIISSGYGVCNGIAKVEQYILERIGIKCEIICSATHTFLKLKDIELPLANGEIVKGNTILDPTWNLASHKFGGIPHNFCISYEEARANDIDSNGKDYKCHLNDEELKDATLSLDEQSLRQLFASVNLADKDGKFPIRDLIMKSELLHTIYANEPEQNVSKQFLIFSKDYPEFAKSPNETTEILKVLLSNPKLDFDRCAINKVYDRTDKEKKPILFVYIDFGDAIGKKFYYVNKNKGEFVQLQQEEFINQFECYDEDLKKSNGVRPWETNEKETTDLSKSSGNINCK